MVSQTEIVRQAIKQFTAEFVKNPYLCYTEHGQHAMFYTLLYNVIAPERRYTTWNGHKVCVIQKEYPTAGDLGKPRRQHWDIAIIKTPPQSTGKDKITFYDYLRLAAVLEFGMNEAEVHVLDDIERVCHADANVEQGYIVHLYRLSKSGARLSGRDWAADSKRIVSKERVVEMSRHKPVEIFYGMYDGTGRYANGVWAIKQGTIVSVW